MKTSPGLLPIIESGSKIIAFAAAAIGAIGALVTYQINSAAELRMRDQAELETDLKVSALFSDLVQKANGYGQWSEPNDKVIEATMERLPKPIFESVLLQDPKSIFRFFAGSRIPEPVPLSAQVAAAESIVDLTIKYPFLKEPAIRSFEILKMASMPGATKALARLCQSIGQPSECAPSQAQQTTDPTPTDVTRESLAVPSRATEPAAPPSEETSTPAQPCCDLRR